MASNREVLRKQIQLLAAEKYSIYKISKTLGISYNTAKKWSKSEEYKHHYNTRPKLKLTPNTKRKISGIMKNKIGSSLRSVCKTLNMSTNYKIRHKTISPNTIKNYLKTKDWGKIARKLKIKPLLSKKNIEDRLIFALNVQMWGYCDDSRQGRALRENVLWTDESPIELNPTPNRQNTRVRALNEDLQNYGIPKHPLKIMVAGGMTALGVTELYVFEPKEYINGIV